MTSQKTISSLSIAAIALLAIATTSFAQTQSDRDAQSSVATQASESIDISNAELIAATKATVALPAIAEVERTTVSNITRTAIQPRLSANAFKVQNNFTSATSSHLISSQQTFNAGPSDPTAKKQFRADDDSSSQGRKPVTFIPSRGPKLPE